MRFWAVILIAAATADLRADILHLRSGARHYGSIVSENAREVVFRVWLAEGSTAVRTFAAADVARVERTAVDRPPFDTVDDDSAAPEEQSGARDDFEQMIREAFELLDDGDAPAALRALQRVVVRAPAAELERLSQQVRTARRVGLDELLAQTRIAAILKAGNGLRVRYATAFEARALSAALERLQDEALGRTFSERSIVRWVRAVDDYKDLQPDTREMVEAARVAAGAIGGRLKYDGRLRVDRLERERLSTLRADLARFVAKVTAMKGYTAKFGDDSRNSETDRALLEAAAAQRGRLKSSSVGAADESISDEQP
jgi:hypothetical protein